MKNKMVQVFTNGPERGCEISGRLVNYTLKGNFVTVRYQEEANDEIYMNIFPIGNISMIRVFDCDGDE